MRIITLIFLVVAVCAGCAGQHFARGSGDAGAFILRQAVAHGGRPATTNSLPVVGQQWQYSEDEYGVIIHLPRDYFPAVESFLHQAFGEPALPIGDLKGDGKMGMYASKDIGVSIQFGYHNGETFVHILRPISEHEMIEHLPEALEQAQKSQ